MSLKPARKHGLQIDNPETAFERFTDLLGRLMRVSKREIDQLDQQQKSERKKVEKKREPG